MADEQGHVSPVSAFKDPRNTESAKYHRDITRARAEGVVEGRTLARKEVIDFLQEKYLGDNSPRRKSPEANAILTLTREVVQFMQERMRS